MTFFLYYGVYEMRTKQGLARNTNAGGGTEPQGPSPGYGLPWVRRDVEPGSFLAAASRRPVACAASLLAPSLRHETDQRHTGGRPGVITWAVPQFVRSLWLNANPACSRWLCSRRDDRSADLELTDGLIVPNRMRPAGVRLAHTMTSRGTTSTFERTLIYFHHSLKALLKSYGHLWLRKPPKSISTRAPSKLSKCTSKNCMFCGFPQLHTFYG
jgi:hypothetical protein